ncbi:MAG: hypothetical protein AAFR01_00060, partial [Pseudomonadota bacterium]
MAVTVIDRTTLGLDPRVGQLSAEQLRRTGESVEEQRKVETPYTFTPALAREMKPLYERVKDVVTPLEWPVFAPLIKQINTLKA